MPEAIEPALLFKNLFLPWLLFNWLPEINFNIEGFLPNEPIALHYCKKYDHRLSTDQKNFIERICETHFSFFVILEVIPNKALRVKDIFLESEYWVKEKLGTQMLTRGDIVFGRVLTLAEQSIFVGMGNCIIDARYHYELLKLREDLIKENQDQCLTPTLLRETFGYEMSDYFFSIVREMFDARVPGLSNTDGEPLQLCKSFFSLSILPEEALKKLLPLTLSNDIEEFLLDAKKDRTGVVTEVEIPWLKKGAQFTLSGIVWF